MMENLLAHNASIQGYDFNSFVPFGSIRIFNCSWSFFLTSCANLRNLKTQKMREFCALAKDVLFKNWLHGEIKCFVAIKMEICVFA